MQTTPPEYMTISEAAEVVGIREWQLGRLYERGLLSPPRKFGRYRLVRPDDLPAIIEAARVAGYLSTEAVAS